MALRVGVFFAVLLVMPSTALGQAPSQTYVSATGDDADPCSRAAPCRTLSGAIGKTAAGGEIDVVDAASVGNVTIAKSITIRGDGTFVGISGAGTNSIFVNAAATDRVTLSGLHLDGVNNVPSTGTALSGLKVQGAGTVRLVDSTITRYRSGITFVPTTSNTELVVEDSEIFDNGIGIIGAPGNGTATGLRTLVERTNIESNICGVVVTSRGTNGTNPAAASNCGGGTADLNGIRMSVFDSSIAGNTTGLFADGSGAEAAVAGDVITQNGTGLQSANGARIVSLGRNMVSGNTTDGGFTQEL